MTEIAKSTGYAILTPPAGLILSKCVGYAVISTERNIVITKAVVYAVLEAEEAEEEGGVGPFVFIL